MRKFVFYAFLFSIFWNKTAIAEDESFVTAGDNPFLVIREMDPPIEDKRQRFDVLTHKKFFERSELLKFVNGQRTIRVVNIETKWNKTHLWRVFHLWYLEPVVI